METTVKLTVADNFSAQLRSFATALDQSEAAIKKNSSEMSTLEKAASSLGNVLKEAATAGIGALVAGLGFSINAAMEGEMAFAKTEAVIKSTGGVAGYTADEIVKMSEALAQQTGVNHDVVESAANVMLTFTAIGHDVFPEVMKAAMDMSVALGKDLQQSVISIGKALQDPTVGLTNLRREGVNVNQAMKDTVKAMMEAGDTMGAQKYILKELETEFGGVAEAAGNTTTGAINKLKDGLDKLGEKIGNALTPAIKEAANALNLIVTGNDQINEAFTQTSKTIYQNSTSYTDYTAQLLGISEAAGKITESDLVSYQTEVERGFMTQAEATQEVADKTGMMSQSMYLAGKEGLDVRDEMAALAKVQKSDLIPATEETAKQIQAETKAFEGYLKEITQDNFKTDEFATKQLDLQEKATALRLQIEKLQDAQGQSIVTHGKAKLSTDELAAAHAKLAMVTEDLTNKTRKKNETDAEFNSRMAGLVVQSDKLKSSIDGTTKSVSGYIDNTKEIGKLTAEYDKANAAVAANAKAHEEATKRIIFGYLEQRLSIDGLTAKEQDVLMGVANRFGLIDDQTVKTIAAINGVTDSFDPLKGNVQETIDKVDNLTSNILNIPTVKSLLLDIQYSLRPTVGDIPNMGNPSGIQPSAIQPSAHPTPHVQHGGPHAAAGLDMTVPPGYPTDNYRINAKSGERVQITPANQRAKDLPSIIINVNGAGDPLTVAQKVGQELTRMLRSAVGNPSYASGQ